MQHSYASYTIDNGRWTRDVESLKQKFRKLANSTKPSGDPDCPPAIRRAKYIARTNSFPDQTF